MDILLGIIKIIALLAAAAILGHWFLAEVKKTKALGRAWYRPYLSPPGIMIIGAIFAIPIIAWMLDK